MLLNKKWMGICFIREEWTLGVSPFTPESCPLTASFPSSFRITLPQPASMAEQLLSTDLEWGALRVIEKRDMVPARRELHLGEGTKIHRTIRWKMGAIYVEHLVVVHNQRPGEFKLEYSGLAEAKVMSYRKTGIWEMNGEESIAGCGTSWVSEEN